LEAGGEAFLYKADVSQREEARSMVEETVRRYGGLDILVNNAAMQPYKFIGGYDAATFEWLWDINIGGYCRMVQESLPYLRRSACPRIVNISSVHSKRPTVFDPGYAMTKAAIRMFTREAAIELAKDHITVNRIELGACKIEQKTGNYPSFAYTLPEENANPAFPLGRIVYPEDVGNLVLYMASPEAEILTGTGVRLDGGSMLI
jgi:glucose 1-dehydrogenase